MRVQKFRRLSNDELASLEKEFIDFLIVNSIDSSDWIKIKSYEVGRAEEMICIFSDMIFETLMQKTKYIENYSKKHFICLDILEKEAHCINLTINNSSNLEIDRIILGTQLSNASVEEYDISFATKTLSEDRSVFLFNEIKKGFAVSDGKLYRSLLPLIVQS